MDNKQISHKVPQEEVIQMLQDELAKTNSELMQLTLELEDRVNQRTKELLQANKELMLAKEKAEESDRLKTAFLQNMSHEIRTPMNGILGFTELLKAPNLSGEKQKEFIEIIRQSGNRMLNIINDIIDLSKIESGHIDVLSKKINVNDLLQELYVFFKPEAEIKGLDLICRKELQDDLSIIETDETKLMQILSNLLKNALKFTQEGTITFGYEIEKNLLIFFVQDTGIGIPENKIKTIFERFIQGDINISRDYEGAGLGLTISKAYIEKLGGEIWLKSELGKGTTFFFYVPCELINVNLIKTQVDKPLNNNLKTKNILIVEDDQISMSYLREILEEENANLFYASNGKEALEKVRTTPEIQIVLMDLKMRIMDGFESTRLIKKEKPHLPVIAQSAYAFSNDLDKAKEAGCNDFIRKPVKKELLLSLINKHLSGVKAY